MAFGVLKRGFSIQTPILSIKIPKGTVVHFGNEEIVFEGLRCLRLMRDRRSWLMEIYGVFYRLVFDEKKPPYPLSYYRK